MVDPELFSLVVDGGEKYQRAALLERGSVVSFYLKKNDEPAEAGNIYLGQVTDSRPGLPAFFIDIGSDGRGFLPRQNILTDENLNKGNFLIVQIEKEASYGKNPKLTQHIQLADENLVYLPYSDYIAVSRHISESRREELRRLAAGWCRPPEGVIVRTRAGRQSEDRLRRSFGLLQERWRAILADTKADSRPRLLEQTLSFVEWILSENHLSTVGAIYANCDIETAKPLGKTQMIRERRAGIFRLHSLEEAFERAMKRVVYLKSGAALAIDYTEALTAIDVNSRTFSGKAEWEDAAFQINCEAAEEIARQLRLRQIGGIIVIDFIHMVDHRRSAQLLALLADLFRNDPVTTKVLGYTRLGLVEISRKKKRYGLQDLAMEKMRLGASD